MGMQIEAASRAGAYVSGVDLDKIATEAQSSASTELDALRHALGAHGVLFFRDQKISPASHIKLAEQFGVININRFFTALDDYPQIAQVLKEPDQQKNIGEKWHTDHSYDEAPALGSILVARELPATGGDTLFASMYAAYDALSEQMKNRLQGLTALHSSRHAFGAKAYDKNGKKDYSGRLGNSAAATQDVNHPVVIRHPLSGKCAIYVNPGFTLAINELNDKDSESLLAELFEHCQNEQFIHRFNWLKGSVAFWDNRATWHSAMNDYAGQRRLMHRVTIEGQRLIA